MTSDIFWVVLSLLACVDLFLVCQFFRSVSIDETIERKTTR